MCKSKKILIAILFGSLSACTQSTWTEGFEYYGFKVGFESNVNYKIGGYTKLVINVTSEMYKELTYPLTLNVYINKKVCASKTLNRPTSKLLLSAKCEENLGPGKHILKAQLVAPDDYKNLSNEKDKEKNHYHGSITYTLEE